MSSTNPITISRTSEYPSTEMESDYMAQVPYASLVESLMYAITCTRPNIAHVVSMVSRYRHDPGKVHWQAAKWILQYILGTMGVGLKFEQSDRIDCFVLEYVESDYANDFDKMLFNYELCF